MEAEDAKLIFDSSWKKLLDKHGEQNLRFSFPPFLLSLLFLFLQQQSKHFLNHNIVNNNLNSDWNTQIPRWNYLHDGSTRRRKGNSHSFFAEIKGNYLSPHWDELSFKG